MRLCNFIRLICVLVSVFWLCCEAPAKGGGAPLPGTHAIVSTSHQHAAVAAAQAAAEDHRMIMAVWYSLYIMVCLGVLVYWEYRRWRAHSWLGTAFRG